MLSLALFSLLTVGIGAECPNINDLPVLNEQGDKFFCGFTWNDYHPWDQHIPLEGCNGAETPFLDDYDYPGTPGYFAQMGSIIVKAGCTLYAYSDHDYIGERVDFIGPATFPDGCTGGRCPTWNSGDFWGWPSFKCRCQQDPIICEPSDRWKTIMQCDNTPSSVETKCSYTKVIGTTFTNTAQESMNIDTTIEAAMSEAFFEFFSADIGTSITTGYDWTDISSQAKSETEEFKVETVVPPHTLLIIEGAEGNCGGNNVKTELFRMTTVDGKGNILSQKLEYTNGKEVPK